MRVGRVEIVVRLESLDRYVMKWWFRRYRYSNAAFRGAVVFLPGCFIAANLYAAKP